MAAGGWLESAIGKLQAGVGTIQVLTAGHLLQQREQLRRIGAEDLHLFTRRVSTMQVRVSDCHCTSMFLNPRTGKLLPEADSFGWFGIGRLEAHCARSMATLLVTKGLATQALTVIEPSAVSTASAGKPVR